MCLFKLFKMIINYYQKSNHLIWAAFLKIESYNTNGITEFILIFSRCYLQKIYHHMLPILRETLFLHKGFECFYD